MKMSKLKSDNVASNDQGYNVYVVVWEATVGQILLCRRKGSKIHDSYAFAVVENNNTPIDNDAPLPYFMKVGIVIMFTNCPETTKFAEVLTLEEFPLCGS